ncbi:MAG TPA: LuxR family transcriptional regulator [Trebonia sp.]
MEPLFGRKEACGRLDGMIDAASRGMSSVLVLRGEPGVGKTALLRYAEAAAGRLQVVRLEGVHSEMEIGYAALHQLIRPDLDRIGILPAPQADALRLAFGMREGGRPDRLFVALAALGLLADRAAGQPLLCVVDDANCLDRESAEVLAFMARRLCADAIAMVFTVRDPAPRRDVLGGLQELRLIGLEDSEAEELLVSVAGPGLPPAVRAHIVAETGGNPLALTEIGQALAAGHLIGELPLPHSRPLPIGRCLEARYLREIHELPDGTQTLLLTAAADPTGDPELLWQAGKELGFGPAAAAPAGAGRLLTIDTTVRFRHPLVRSAVYYGALLSERRRVHAALAGATDPVGDQERRAWHRGEATSGFDETVAAELERVGELTAGRGGWTAAGTFYARSAALSADPAARARRLLSAADAYSTGNVPGRAQALVDEAAAYRDDRRHRGLVQRTQGRLHQLVQQPAAAASALLGAAADLGPLDVRLARDILIDAVVVAQNNGRLAPDGATRLDIARVARSLPLPPGAPRTPGDELLDADTVLQYEGLAAAAPRLRRAIDAVRRETSDSPETLRWLAVACANALALADDVVLQELARRMELQARAQGALVPLSFALNHAGSVALVAGMLTEAEQSYTERASIEEARGHGTSLGALLVAAWRGSSKETYPLLDAVESEATGQGQGYQLMLADYARCVLELGRRHYAEASGGGRAGRRDIAPPAFALADFAEAAQRSGRPGDATHSIERLEQLAAVSPVPRTLGSLARARALVTEDGSRAEELYREAIYHHERTRGGSHIARSHLVYGEWLRRARRARDARRHLRDAHEIFDGMGAKAFATRARLELQAAGATTRPRGPGKAEHLTPQEATVARLAATGATNAEIASQLYVSASTVDYHLRKVFRKLDVTSRRQLARADLDGT